MSRLCVDNRLGGRKRYYLSDGSPLMQVPDEIRKCVAFIGYRNADGNERFAGTGFFTAVETVASPKMHFQYFVTARHVIESIRRLSSDGKCIVRVNHKTDGAATADCELSPWVYHPTDPTVDVAITPLAFSPKEVDFFELFDGSLRHF
jgi:hypothetical protein